MEIICCKCNWDIPGVDELPWHVHKPVMEVIDGVYGPTWDHPDAGIEFNIDWKELYRSVCVGT